MSGGYIGDGFRTVGNLDAEFRGGQIDGNGLFIDEWGNFNIYGRDLIYSDGWLTGYLQDGNWFNNQLTFGSNWRGTFA
jgi:hypothetical protein